MRRRHALGRERLFRLVAPVCLGVLIGLPAKAGVILEQILVTDPLTFSVAAGSGFELHFLRRRLGGVSLSGIER